MKVFFCASIFMLIVFCPKLFQLDVGFMVQGPVGPMGVLFEESSRIKHTMICNSFLNFSRSRPLKSMGMGGQMIKLPGG